MLGTADMSRPQVPDELEPVLREGEPVLVSTRARYLGQEGRATRDAGAVLVVTPARWIDLGADSAMVVSWEWDDVQWMVAEKTRRSWVFRFQPRDMEGTDCGYRVSKDFARTIQRIQAGEIPTTRLAAEETIALPDGSAGRRAMTPVELESEGSTTSYRCAHCDEELGVAVSGPLRLYRKCPGCCRVVAGTPVAATAGGPAAVET